jgi:UDP-N-acetylglucosamine 3-dehydrogenase
LFNIAIIGAGNIAEMHADAYKKMNDVNVKAVVDIDGWRAETLAKKVQADFFTDLEEVLRDPSISAVDICLPTYLHLDTVVKAAKAKKNVICEKPIALAVEDAEKIFSVCESFGVELYVAQVCRFMNSYRKMVSILSDQKLGSVKMVRLTRAIRYPVHDGQSWYQDTEKSGGPFIDFIIHDFDFLTWCFGKPDHIVFSERVKTEEMEGILVCLKYNEGPIVRLEGVWSAAGYDDLHQRIEVDGMEGHATYDSQAAVPWLMKTLDGEYITLNEQQLSNDPFYEELRHFIHCFQQKSEPLVTKEQVVFTLETALKAKEIALKMVKGRG